MYIIYTNELPEVICDHQGDDDPDRFIFGAEKCGSICCFADDSSYSYSNKDTSIIADLISSKFQIISDFMASHELKLNSSKTHLLLLMSDSLRRSKPNLDLSLNTCSEIIETSRSEKLLGGLISQNLKFKEHIQNDENSMLRVLNVRINALKLVCNLTGFKTWKMIANGVILTKLIYLVPLWADTD